MSDSERNIKGGRRTRRNRAYHPSKMSHDEYGCGTTMLGLHEWYTAMFEKLGWMILAKHKKYNDKISAYKNSIKHLKAELEQKID